VTKQIKLGDFIANALRELGNAVVHTSFGEYTMHGAMKQAA
jgi:hypothetical protein